MTKARFTMSYKCTSVTKYKESGTVFHSVRFRPPILDMLNLLPRIDEMPSGVIELPWISDNKFEPGEDYYLAIVSDFSEIQDKSNASFLLQSVISDLEKEYVPGDLIDRLKYLKKRYLDGVDDVPEN